MNNITVEVVLDIMARANLVKDVNVIVYDQPLNEQGVDSLDFSGLLFNLEEELKVEIPDEDIDDLITINDIVNYINSKK